MTLNNSHILLTGFLALVLVAGMTSPAFAGANGLEEGSFLTDFDSGVGSVGLGFDGQFLYVPNGISSSSLSIFATDSTPQAGLELGCTIGNLSFDSSRNVFWAYDMLPNTVSPAISAPVWTINPNTGECNFEFDALALMNANGACGGFCSWPADGIDWDDRDDTIRLSPDASTIIYNFNTGGTLASQFGPIDTFDECGFDFSSGVATGISNVLYLATNGCQEVFKFDKDTGVELNHFTITAERNEAMECDSVTFSGEGTDAIWVKDLTGLIQAFAVPLGTCEMRGGGGGGNQPIGGTSFAVSTTTLLVAGVQANMGLWSLALVAIVGAGAAITYKLKSKKTKQ